MPYTSAALAPCGGPCCCKAHRMGRRVSVPWPNEARQRTRRKLCEGIIPAAEPLLAAAWLSPACSLKVDRLHPGRPPDSWNRSSLDLLEKLPFDDNGPAS